jgi:phytoene dehydrogenase-like protein
MGNQKVLIIGGGIAGLCVGVYLQKNGFDTEIVEMNSIETRFPAARGRFEEVDVATPASVVRYTGNWKGSIEGFLLTPAVAARSAGIEGVLHGRPMVESRRRTSLGPHDGTVTAITPRFHRRKR